MDTLDLGGNIQLIGFSELDSGKMIVVKKIVGNYGRKLSEKSKFERLSVTLEQTGTGFEIKGELAANEKQIEGNASDSNMFIALDNALKGIEKNLD